MRRFALILAGFLVELTAAEVAPGVRKSEAGEPEALSQITQAKFRFVHGSVASALHDNKKVTLEIYVYRIMYSRS